MEARARRAHPRVFERSRDRETTWRRAAHAAQMATAGQWTALCEDRSVDTIIPATLWPRGCAPKKQNRSDLSAPKHGPLHERRSWRDKIEKTAGNVSAGARATNIDPDEKD